MERQGGENLSAELLSSQLLRAGGFDPASRAVWGHSANTVLVLHRQKLLPLRKALLGWVVQGY